MKRIILTVALCVTGLGLASCGAPAANNGGNANSNSNANAAKPMAAAPTADSLLAMDKQANEAYFKGDSKFFEGFMSDKFAWAGQKSDKAGSVAMIAKSKCDVKSFNLDEPQMSKIDDDTYALTYKGTFDGECNDGPGSAMKKLPSPVRGATVFIRNGDKWQAAFHAENPISTGSKNPAAETKTEEPKKEDKPAANSTANSNANTAPAAPAATKSANTDALAKAELAGWEAWQKKDAKGLDAVTAKNVTIVNSNGDVMTDRAAIIKYWAEMPCEGVTKVDVKDPFGIAFSANTEMLTFHGWSDGSCFGSKNGTQPAMSIYVKEGDAWKLAYSINGPTE
ncbi:MAG TPA: nuclear transport factor 2 family protein [Pyrinomonadaceae bacterium]|jgi:hypothetical protein|nr:nuclear transport factor 2 family protein [Pyrinomonadaceae bacterium]